MEPRQIAGTGIAASALAHLSVLALMIFFSQVHPFSSDTAEPIAVELVSPAEVNASPDKEEPPPAPKVEALDKADLASPSSPAAQPPPAPRSEAATPPQEQALRPAPPPKPQQADVRPQTAKPLPPSPSPQPAYTPPAPDLTVKYHVMLGLPPALPPSLPAGKSDDNFDAPASQVANISSSLITEFRRHLKTCSKLPAAIAPSDDIEITLRVFMTPEGRLAAEPIPIGIRHPSESGPALQQSAIAALHACEPYRMLPPDRYGEWKVLDLSFTTRDFGGG
jgi:hypothetical protein